MNADISVRKARRCKRMVIEVNEGTLHGLKCMISGQQQNNDAAQAETRIQTAKDTVRTLCWTRF